MTEDIAAAVGIPSSNAGQNNNHNDVDSSQHDYESCHSLPCKIEFSGRAPVQVYFLPQLISGGTEDKQDNSNKDANPAIYSAQFRGRQLLATEPYQHHSTAPLSATTTTTTTPATPATTRNMMEGRLLEINVAQPNTSRDKIQVKGRFQSIMEWKHESEPDVVRNAACPSSKSRVVTALQWCDVARALHDPIPVEST